MNKQNIILDFETFLNSYKHKPKISRNKFPIKNNTKIAEEYSYIIGKIMGDGNLDDKFTSRFIGREGDLMLLKEIFASTLNLNSERITIRNKKAKGNSSVLQINDAFFGRILYLLGTPIGNKTKISFEVPKWIFENQKNKKRFLQALLEDELTTIKIEKNNYSVKPRLKMAKRPEFIEEHKEFMQQVKKSIESFGLECNHISKPVKTDTKCLDIYFHINRNKRNILKFQKEIGFRLNQNNKNRGSSSH